MENVCFNKLDKSFSCNDATGKTFIFDFIPSIDNLWEDIDYNDFMVELCINPYLNRELKDIRQLKNEDNTLGYIFPITLIDTEQDISNFRNFRNLNCYLFVAYKILLERIPEINNTLCFSENFEKNISVCIINKKSMSINIDFVPIIHNLRYLGYSYFFPKNNVIESDGYDKAVYQDIGKQINIDLKGFNYNLLNDETIKSLLEVLQSISNSTHRFILLYQIIEYLMSIEYRKSIDEEISTYNNFQIPHNDFIDRIKNLEKESSRIRKIFERCKIKAKNQKRFKDKWTELHTLINYAENSTNLYELFYHFRNQMTHSYREIHTYKKEMGETIQAFELVVLDILGSYK